MLPSQPLSDNSKDSSSAIRHQWQLFQKWFTTSRSAMEKQREEQIKTLDDELILSKRETSQRFHGFLQEQCDAKKNALNHQLHEAMVEVAQEEWLKRLATARLKPEDWIDITMAERIAVERALGGDFQDYQLHPPTNPSHGAASLSNARGQQVRAMPYPTQVSPMEFVDSSSFGEEHSQNDPPSIQSVQAHNFTLEDNSDRRPVPVAARNLSQESPVFHNPTEPPSEPPYDDSSTRPRIAARYIGPVLHDSKDTKVEEEDFERFKHEIRKQKIWEFHFQAAEADTHLSLQLCDKKLDKQRVKTLLAEHESSMELLQRAKEDERRSIVHVEREKRRMEFRRRGALHDAAATPWRQFEAVIGIGHDRDAPGSRLPEQFARDSGSRLVNGINAASWGQATEATIPPRDDPPVASTSRNAVPDPAWTSFFRKSSHQTEDKVSPERNAATTPPKNPDPSPLFASHRSQVPSTDNVRVSHAAQAASAQAVEANMGSKLRRKNPPRGPQVNRKPESLDPPSAETQAIETPPEPLDATLDCLPPVTSQNLVIRTDEFWVPDKIEKERDSFSGLNPDSNGVRDLIEAELNSDRKCQEVERNMATKRGRNARNLSIAPPESQPRRDRKVVVAGREKRMLAESSSRDTPSAAEATLAAISRARGVSEPPSPNPSLFKAAAVQKQKSEGDASMQPKSILKKTGIPQTASKPVVDNPPRPARKKGRQNAFSTKLETPPKTRKRVTIEEVSDEEADPLVVIGSKEGKLLTTNDPSKPGVLFEPQPSNPSTSVSPIAQHKAGEEPRPQPILAPEISSTSSTSLSENPPPEIWYPTQDPSVDQEDDVDWTELFQLQEPEEKPIKAKHVRWTPSVLGRSGSPDVAMDPLQALAGIGWNPFLDHGSADTRSSSSIQRIKSPGNFISAFDGMFESVTGEHLGGSRKDVARDLKGKGRERAVRDDPIEAMEEDFGWIESLKSMRSKPASAV